MVTPFCDCLASRRQAKASAANAAPAAFGHQLTVAFCDCFASRRRAEASAANAAPLAFGHLLTRDLLPTLPAPVVAPPRAAFEQSAAEAELVRELRERLRAFLVARGTPEDPPGVLTEQRLLRYVRFIDGPATECERMIALRESLGMDDVYACVAAGQTYPGEAEMDAVWTHNLHGRPLFDRDGRPVFIAQVGGLSETRALFQQLPPALVRSHLHHCLEQLNQTVSQRSEAEGTLRGWTYVLDLSGVSLWQSVGCEASRSFFKQLGDEVNRLAVPYQIAVVLLVHAPVHWQLVWKAVRRILPPRVQRKVRLCADVAELDAFIQPHALPARYKGTCADDLVFVRRGPMAGAAAAARETGSKPLVSSVANGLPSQNARLVRDPSSP